MFRFIGVCIEPPDEKHTNIDEFMRLSQHLLFVDVHKNNFYIVFSYIFVLVIEYYNIYNY